MSDEKMSIAVSTLGAIVLGFLAPLIIYLVNKDKLADPAKSIVISTLNFELTLMIAGIILCLIPFVGALLCALLSLFNIIMLIIAFSAGNKGSVYKYPFNIPFIK